VPVLRKTLLTTRSASSAADSSLGKGHRHLRVKRISGGALEQIQSFRGHGSFQATERYTPGALLEANGWMDATVAAGIARAPEAKNCSLGGWCKYPPFCTP
jgi:hypothetical protein